MGNERVLNTRLKMLAVAVGLAWSGLVGAATLGEISILSGRGQPLQAEVELALASDAEAGEVVTHAYSPEEFWNKSGQPVEASVRGLSTHLSKRANGRYFIKIWSESAVELQQVALLVEVAFSAGGKSVREYIFPLSTMTAAAEASVAETNKTAVPEAKSAAEPSVEVKAGDTLNKIAQQHKPAEVSLERMLVALYRANPQAFASRNMNRLKTGKVLRIPQADEIEAINQRVARKEIRAHVADWKSYRNKVMAKIPALTESTSGREATGKLENAVSAQESAGQAPAEVLKLSRGDAPGAREAAAEVKSLKDKLHSMEEDLAARDKALKEREERISMLEKNNREMQKLIELKSTLAPVAPPVAASDVVPAEAPVQEVASAVAAVSEVVAAPVASEVVAEEPAPVVNEKASSVAKFLWGGAAALLAGGGLFFFLRRGRKEEKPVPVRKAVADAEAPASPFPDASELLVTSAIAQESAEAMVDVTSERAAHEEEQAVIETHPQPVSDEEATVQISPAAYDAEAQDAPLEAAPDKAEEAAVLDPWRADVESEPMIELVVEPEPELEAVPEDLTPAEVKLDFDVPGFIPEQTAAQAERESAETLELVMEETPAEVATPAETPIDDDMMVNFGGELATAESPQGNAAVAVSEEFAAATDMPSFEPVQSFEAAYQPSAFEPVPSPSFAHEMDAAPVEAPTPAAEPSVVAAEAPAALELDIPTIADFTPAESAALPPMPGMEGVSLNLVDDTNLTEEELQAKGEHWLQVATKLDLARAYQEMGDDDGAREILEEVLVEGDAEQRATAEQLLQAIA
jgi:pilus assembly protein FimV